MHDIRKIRETPELFDKAWIARGEDAVAAELVEMDERRRNRIREAEEAKSARNALSAEAAAAKKAGNDAEFERLREEIAAKKQDIHDFEQAEKVEEATLRSVIMTLPNVLHADVPEGKDEADNVELRRWGHPRNFAFDPKQHYEVPGAAAGLDFERAAKLSGSRFVVMTGAMIRLHRALGQFMLDTHTGQNGLTEVWTPVLVRDEAMEGTGQLPKFEEDSYRTTNGWWLVPTSEVTLTNLHAGEIMDAAALPRRYTTLSQCFRSEAGSAGRDTAGMLRQHQFEKVEMVSIVKPDDGETELERMTRCAEAILEALELPYRTMILSSGDIGFAALRTNDIEVWLPGQNTYREISSCSLCGDFQARRMNARFRPAAGEKPEFVHTLNGSGLAVGRTLIAVVENYQEEDGSIRIPATLKSRMGDAERITPDGTLA